MAIVQYKGLWYNSDETVTYPEKLNVTFPLIAPDEDFKLTINGKVTLNTHHGSYAHKPEVVLSVYSPLAPKKSRRNGNGKWYRMELPFPISSATRDFFLECARKVDAKLKGIE